MITPLVSVIIPNYNTARLLCEAIDSVLQSTMQDFEIIVVDDGGQEVATLEIGDKYKPYPNVIFHRQQNKGLAGARNTGILLAKGEFLVFLDSDDLLLPEKIDKQITFLRNNPTCDIVYSYSDWFLNDDPKNRLRANFPVYEGLILKNLLYGNFIHVNTPMVRKTLIQEVGGFKESLRELEDWELWLRLSVKGARFCCIPEVLSLVRVRSGSMTNNQAKMNRTMVRVLTELKSDLMQHAGLYKAVKKAYFHSLHLYKIQAGLQQGYFKSLCNAMKECGISFAPMAIKLGAKSVWSRFGKIENKTTRELEKYWNQK